MEYQKNILGPSGSFISTAVMRYISLAAAEKGEKIALAYGNGKIFGQVVTKDDSTNDKWRMIQVSNDTSDFFYLYHCETGLCLARDKNNNITLTKRENLQTLDLHKNLVPSQPEFYGIWKMRGNERGIYVVAPDMKTPNWSTNDPENYMNKCVSQVARDKKPQIREGAANPKNWFSPIFPGDPIGGNVYILLKDKDSSGNYNITLGPPAQDSIKDMECLSVVQKGDKSHAWYMLPQTHISNEVFNIPVRTGFSLGEFFSWVPSTEVNSAYNVSREKLATRFIDPLTQIVPQQSEYPKICAITQDPNAVDCMAQYTSNDLFNRTTTFNWQYIDIYGYFGGDQGYCPDELRNISIENMGQAGNFNNIGPGPLSNPIDGKYQPNTANLYTYIDGKRSAGLGGRITIPPKWMVDACHKNGVKCYGSIFFQELYYGGKWGWWVQFCQDPELSAKKMADMANYYGFDGWLFNLETGPPDQNMFRDYAGQVYSGVNQLTGEKADEYWCNSMAGAKFPTWWVNQGSGPWQDDECGSADNWPCSCLPQNVNPDTLKQTCGSKSDNYSQGCNNGWLLRENFKKMIKAFNNYRKQKGIEAELFLYDTIQVTSPLGVGISTVSKNSCPDGINNTPKDKACHNPDSCYGNFDFWQDSDGPVADYLFSMRSGCGGAEPSASPQGTTSTYILSQNVEGFKRENFVQENHSLKDLGFRGINTSSKYWPKNTGPDADGIFCPNPSSNNPVFFGPLCNSGEPTGMKNIPDNRALDYYQALQLEGLSGNTFTLEALAKTLNLFTQKGNPQGWDSAIYCGTQSKNLGKLGYGAASGSCVNEENAIEKPMASLNLYYIDILWRWFGSYANIPGYPDIQAMVDWTIQNQLVFWTGARLLSSKNRVNTGTSADYWKGMAHYVSEKSCINSYPFYTSFTLGIGKDFYIMGYPQNFGHWSNWSMQSILPTWMWCPNNEDIEDAQFIKFYFDMDDVYQKSNSLSITTVADPTSWIRLQPPKPTCNLPNNQRNDCDIDNKDKCISSDCCWDETVDPEKYPWCYHKGYSEDSGYIYKTGNKKATYKLYKTQLDLSQGCTLSVTYKITGGSLKFGYVKNSAINDIIWNDLPASKKWTTFVKDIPASKDKIVLLYIQVTLPFDYFSKITLGEICLNNTKTTSLNLIKPAIKSKYTATQSGDTNYILQWKPVDCVYYSILENEKLVGHYYQGKNIREFVKDIPISFSYKSKNENSQFMIRPENENGLASTKMSLKSSDENKFYSGSPLFLGTILVILFLIILLFKNNLSRKLFNTFLVIIGGIALITFIVYAIKSTTAKSIPPDILTAPNSQVEMWQNCKPHVFNACFDDSRTKCWRWLIYMWKKKNWPIKFSFFYNTLWINRDYYILKEWIDMGHEICSHMHDHICPCMKFQAIEHDKDGQVTKWAPVSDQLISDNLILSANLIRKLYGDSQKELVLAWPHGAFPLVDECDKCDPSSSKYEECKNQNCNGNLPCGQDNWGQDCGPTPHDGEPRTQVIKTLEKYYIAARGVNLKLITYNTWPNPSIIPPDSKGKWNTGLWPYNLDPKWGWPYQIDINPSDISHPEELCKKYLENLRTSISLPYGAVIVAGHTFNPTDAEGKDVPCDWTDANQMTDGPYDGSWCKDKNDCQNTYHCPKEIQDITLACWQNAPDTSLPLYKNGNLVDPSFPPDKKYSLQAPTPDQLKNCHQCCDACWDPVPGSCLIELFDEVSAHADLYWFATFTEIVQYVYNRQNSQLKFISNDGNNFKYSLICDRMYNCELTLSFGENNFKAQVDGISVNVYYSDKAGKYFIKFIPKSNTTHTIIITV